MKNLITAILAIFLCAGCSTLPKPEFDPPGPSLKIVTYNINWGTCGWQKIGNYLAEADADVICLQETHTEWENFLKARLKHKYPYSKFSNSGGAGGIAVMSKYKLENIRIIDPEAGWFPALTAEVKSDIGKVRLLNVHLRPPLSDQGSATISALYNSPEIHRKELTQFVKQAGTDLPLIITGDFNEHEDGGGLDFLFDKGFTDTLSLYDQSSDTWEWPLGYGIQLDDRYDHLIFSRQLHCTGAKVLHIDNASDHMPVFGVFVNK